MEPRTSNSCGAWHDECDSKEMDWLVESVRNYAELHMYSLQKPAIALEFIDQEMVFVALKGESVAKCELLGLKLPGRLLQLSSDYSKGGYSRDCDFHVEFGSLTHLPVVFMRYIPNSHFIVTVTDSSLDVWAFRTSSGKLSHEVREEKIIEAGRSPMKGSKVTEQQISIGCKFSAVTTVDLTQMTVVHTSGFLGNHFRSEELISSLHADSKDTLLLGSSSESSVFLMDMRADSLVSVAEATGAANSCKYKGAKWSYDLSMDSCVAVANSGLGEVSMRIWDLRKGDRCLLDVQVAAPPQKESGQSYLQVLKSPMDSDFISISGFDDNVYVYDTNDCHSDQANLLHASFVHKGHAMECSCSTQHDLGIVCHSWHPTIPGLVVSMATDSSLHAWLPSKLQA